MTKGNGRMKKIVTLVFVLLTLLTAAASAESYTQADFEWAEAVEDQSTLTLKEQAKYLDIVKQRQRGIALLAMGGADTPFQIASAAQLAELAQYVNAGDATFVSAHYVLTDDVNLSAYGNWTPIGTINQPFAGVFDGQNHVVTGLKIDRSQGVYQGLFGCVNSQDANRKAQVKNVIVKDAQIRAKKRSGAVVGFYGDWDSQMEPLENCAMVGGSIEGCVDRAGYDQADYIGGVVGLSYADVRFCYSTGTVIVPQSACDIGGVAGWVDGNVQSCYAAGSMDIFPYSRYQIFDIGGLVGGVDDDVSDCYSTVDVVGLGDDTFNFGGVAGTVGGSVTRCFATGNVQAWSTVGGVASVVGTSGGSLTDCVALNGAVSGTKSTSQGISRVGNVFKSEGGSESGNYASKGIPKAGKGRDSLLAADGADLTYDDPNGLSRQFETIFGGNSAWTYAENGLPTLKNVGGTQSSELPSWMLGSETTIYITTAQQLKRLADEVNAGDSKSDKTYLLANDIDLSGYPNWTPIGRFDPPDDMLPFSGVFDGQGYSITGLKISGNEDARGLFGYTYSGAIRNVVIRNPEIEGKDQVGALVGYQAYSNQGIKNCAVIGGKIQGRSHVGGLVGYMEESPIQNCYSTCEVVAMDFYAGGIVGDHRVVASIRNCYATGNISGTYSGGIVGVAQDVERCVALGQTVTGKSSNRVTDSVRISDVYAWGGMKVNGNTVTYGAANNENGADLVYNGGALSTQFSEIFANDDAWTYTENGLPILKALKGAQSSELPTWVKAGSAANVVYIHTMADLANLASAVNSGVNMSGKTFLLMNDIDLSGLNWVPIGYYIDWNNSNNKPFSGVFDGQGHSIIGLTISGGQNDAGLFGYTHLATIRNVVIRNPQIEGRGEVGALVGRQGYSSTGIEKCAVIGGRIQGAGSVGGLVGYMEESPLQNCYTTCEVIATDSYAGGIVGSHLVGASIRSCYATGNVSGRYSGGIAGLTQGIEQCVALGQTVTGDGSSRVMYRSNGNANVYAWSGMKVNNQTVTDGRVDNENGEDILAHNGLLYGKGGQIFAWPGFDTSIWELRNDQPGKLPRFKGTSADPTLNLSAQTSTVTCDVELNGDAGVSGIRYKVNDAANDTEYSGVFTVNLLDKLEIEPTIRTGYAFAQWSDGKTDNPYTMSVTGAVSLTAQTQIETYIIDYELNGGTLEAGKTNPATYTLETAAFRLEEPTRAGYTFAGWTGSNGTTPQTDVGIAQGSTGNLHFEANWTANGYKILYTGVDGADVSTFPTKHVYGTDTAIPNPTKTGYGFAGWKVNGSAAARDLTLSGTAYTADITLEATWTANEFTITYSGVEGADVSTFPTKHVFGKDTAIPNPTKTDYSFAGWKVNGSAAARDLTLSGTAYRADITLEATWTANEFTITYSGVEGADVSTFPTKHVFGKDTAIPNPTKTGYGFAGWKVNGSTAARDLTLSGTAYTADIALEATWTKLTEPTPSVIMEGGTAFIVGKATEDAIMHIGKGVANFGVANLDYVDVDGKRLDPQFYTAKDGSILITVHQAYLNTLSVGEHILTAHLKGPGYEGQTVSGKIVVAPVPDMSNLPQTGDASPVLLWGATLGLCAAVLAVMKRKKK